MACDTQYSVMPTGSLYCLGKNNKSAHVEWRCFFPFYFLWMVCWLNPWPQNTQTWRGDSLWHSFLTSWPLDPWVQLRFSFLALKWRWSNATVIFPGQADVLFSPLFLTSSPSLPFIWPSTPIRFGFYVNTEGPRMSSLDHHWLQNQGTSHQDGHTAPLPISGLTAVYSWDYSRSVVVLPSWVLSCIF